jgi:hypothetical protein
LAAPQLGYPQPLALLPVDRVDAEDDIAGPSGSRSRSSNRPKMIEVEVLTQDVSPLTPTPPTLLSSLVYGTGGFAYGRPRANLPCSIPVSVTSHRPTAILGWAGQPATGSNGHFARTGQRKSSTSTSISSGV